MVVLSVTGRNGMGRRGVHGDKIGVVVEVTVVVDCGELWLQ